MFFWTRSSKIDLSLFLPIESFSVTTLYVCDVINRYVDEPQRDIINPYHSSVEKFFF